MLALISRWPDYSQQSMYAWPRLANMEEGEKEPEKVKIEIELPKEQISFGPEEKKEEEDKKDEEGEEENDSIVKQATGYEVGELVKSPVEPPEHAKSARPVRGQIRSLLYGFALIILGLIAWPIFGFRVAIAVVLVGAAFIALGTLVRL